MDKASFVEKRVKEIFEREHVYNNKRPLKIILVTLIVIPMLVTALALPINAETRQMAKCNQSYCLSAKNNCPSNSDECQKACDLMASG